jgi:4'-phosphopantetheinyl transferase
MVESAELADRYFSRSEAAAVAVIPPDQRERMFMELWTLKEAYVKAVGRGLSHPLDSFSFTFEHPGGLRFDPPPDVHPDEWHFALFSPTDGHRVAVAVHRPAATCRISAFDAAGRRLTGSRVRATAGVAIAADPV